ncbi:hypothetical protein PtB15_4B376 [Puccinia triticina]|nr:hypothetical protein PtB15_4B376 [Puccinia triticina]
MLSPPQSSLMLSPPQSSLILSLPQSSLMLSPPRSSLIFAAMMQPATPTTITQTKILSQIMLTP